jgi:hypothetical protein
METAQFKADWDSTLAQIWDAAYLKLEEPRRAEDRLQTAKGDDVMPYLTLTLKQFQEQHPKIWSTHFQIVGPTGGAVN